MARKSGKDADDTGGFGPANGRGRFSGRYTREQDPKTGGRQFGHGHRGPARPGRTGNSADARPGGGGFEREQDDYQREMGNQDRGRVVGGQTDRDNNFSDLGRRSRFGAEDAEPAREKGK